MKAYLIKKDLHNIDFAVKIWYNINVYWHEPNDTSANSARRRINFFVVYSI